MKLTSFIGIVLLIVGVIALVNGGINYTRTEKVLDIGPIEATAEKHERIPMSPIFGGVALLGGIGLLAAGARHA